MSFGAVHLLQQQVQRQIEKLHEDQRQERAKKAKNRREGK